jgi:hypothetical protein
MGEFSSRVEAQRQILKVVNSRDWSGEQLFAVTTAAIQRWALTNRLDTSTTVLPAWSCRCSSYIDCPVSEPIQPAPQPRTPAPNSAPKSPGMAS